MIGHTNRQTNRDYNSLYIDLYVTKKKSKQHFFSLKNHFKYIKKMYTKKNDKIRSHRKKTEKAA